MERETSNENQTKKKETGSKRRRHIVFIIHPRVTRMDTIQTVIAKQLFMPFALSSYVRVHAFLLRDWCPTLKSRCLSYPVQLTVPG